MAGHMASLGASQCPQPLQISKGRLRQAQALAFSCRRQPSRVQRADPKGGNVKCQRP